MTTDDPDIPSGRFEYFMLRVFHVEEDPRAVVGQVERLDTGEKRRFETAGELLALVTRWPVTTPEGGVPSMRNTFSIATLITALAFGMPGLTAAQSVETVGDTLESASDSGQTKKSGGFLGKVKGVAKNKVVQQIAKTAACNMLPGGQVVAGAIDAAANKDAVGAAAGAATGSTCMPGMGGTGALAGAATGAATPGGGMSPDAMAGMMAGGAMPGGAGATLMMDPAMSAAYAAQMSAMMEPAASSGKDLEIARDLKKGKTVVRNIAWLPGDTSVSPETMDALQRGMAEIAAAMMQEGGAYRLDLYLDKQSAEVIVRSVGPRRLAVVQGWLQEAGAEQPELGKVKKDKDPRLEIVRLD